MVKLQPQNARIIMTDSVGKETILDVESKYVRAGDVVMVNHGDSVPVDGEIIYGDGQIDEHMITGEFNATRLTDLEIINSNTEFQEDGW